MTEEYSSDFITVRRAIYQNFIAKNAPIKEEDLTLHGVYLIIYDIGKHFLDKNIRGLTKIPEEIEE